MARGRTILNRCTLALTGGALIAVAFALLLPRTPRTAHLPDGVTTLGVTPLAATTRLDDMRGHTWWTPTVMAVSVLATLLLALWCARQLRDGPRRPVTLPVPRSVLRTRALEDAVASHTETVEGVDRCRARVRVRRGHLDVLLRVRLRQDTAPGTVLPALTALAGDTRAGVHPYECALHVHFST